MSVIKLKNKETGEYTEIIQEAIETPVEDVLNLFENKNVEAILQEIGLKIKNGVATPEDIALLKRMLQTLSATVNDIKNNGSGIAGVDITVLKEIIKKYEDGELGGTATDIEGIDLKVLKEMIEKYENGELSGGGSGAVSPTIESEFPKESVIEEGSYVDIDIYFQTPNLGEGKLYITVNNVEIDYSPTIQQGDNTIRIAAKYLTKTSNTIALYAKDRMAMTSNRLTFKVISGGVSLTTTFDYTVDYVVGQNILFPFNTVTELSGQIYLHMTIDGINVEPIQCSNGYNSLYLNNYITGVGSHTVSMYAIVGDYKSKVLNFNVVIASSTQLTLSSSTLDGTKFIYGEAIQISYRVSKLGNENFTMKFYLNEVLQRTATVSTGSYYWTIAAGVVPLGIHTVKIEAEGTSGDKAEVTIKIEVVAGEFTPVQLIKNGMSLLLDSDGNSNEMENNNIWTDKSGNGNHAELINFNFSTNGWNPTVTELTPNPNDPNTSISTTVEYKGLVCNNGAYVRIPYKPFVNNVLNGFTMEMVYTPEHSGNNKARVLEYVDHDEPYAGVYVDIDEAFIKSESETTAGQVDLDYESGEIQLDFVIDRENKMCRLYIDGIVSRYWMLSDSGNNRESFAIDQDYIYINFSALSEEFCGGTNVIRKFICYERALSHEEVVNNYIANQPDLVSMQEKYNWCYNTQIPKVQIYGDISNCSSSVPAYVRIKYISTDSSLYGESFDLESSNSPIYLQGTSSLGYSRKNFRFILVDSNGQEYFHEMFPNNALPESTYTLKCDYVDSSMSCNVTLCKIANDTLYGKNFTVAQRDNPKRRTATYGHPIELVNIVNNQEISLGAYVIVIDRYAEKSMGYDQKEYPNILCVEGESNSDVGASSFHSYSNPESSGNQFPNEIAYVNEGFKVVYPPTNEDSYDFAPIRELINFVDLSSDDDFKDTFESYFDKESVLRYYLFCLCFASVDTLSKNLHFCRYKDVWYVLPYDLDSVLGGSNVGFLNISSSCEIGDLYDEDDPTIIVEKNQFNSWNSRLWARVRDTFNADLIKMWTTLRSNGTFNYDNFIKFFDEITDLIPPTMYNESQQIKYIDYGTVGQIALHGNRKHQIRKFLRERMAYLDSKFGFYSDGGSENYVNIRMNTLGNVNLEIETYYPVYYTVKWATNNIETHRIPKNGKKKFSYYSDVSTDREVLLYLPQSIKKISGLDSLKPASIDISKATKLTEISCKSDKLYSVSLTNNKYLRKIDFNGCKLLGTDTVSTLTLIYAKYLNYVDVRGTQLTAVNFSDKGGSLEKCYLPSTLTSLTVKNQMLLTDLILPYGDNGEDIAKKLATVEISNCPSIKRVSEIEGENMFAVMKYCRSLILNNSFNLESMDFNGFTRLQNITLSNIDTLKDIGLNDLCEAGTASNLKYVGVSACLNLKTINMNCSSSDYVITFADDGLLDLSTSNVTTINSNCIIKGLKTIVVPRTIEEMYFTNDYGSGYSDIKNIWATSSSVIDSSGVFPSAKHMDAETFITDDYEGIDFYGLHLNNIDLGALVNIPEAINFTLSPTNVNPNFNLNRNGSSIPYLKISGSLNLTNYTGSLSKFFNGVNLDELRIICDTILPQTDYSYCLYNAKFSDLTNVKEFLKKVGYISNASYMFAETIIDNVDIMEQVELSKNAILDYMFSGTKVKNIDNLTLATNIKSARGFVSRCKYLTSAKNLNISINGPISHFFDGCTNLIDIGGLIIKNVTAIDYILNNCLRISADLRSWDLSKCNEMSYALAGTQIENNIDLSNLKLGSSNCKYNNLFGENLDNISINLSNSQVNANAIETIIEGIGNVSLNLTGVDLSKRTNFDGWFENCDLVEIILDNVTWSDKGIHFNRAFKNTRISKDFLLPITTTRAEECFSNISTLTHIHSNWEQEFKDYVVTNEWGEVLSRETLIPTNCYAGNNAITHCDDIDLGVGEFVHGLDQIPIEWGGNGFTKGMAGIYVFTIPSDNYTISFGSIASRKNFVTQQGIVNWGDGSPKQTYKDFESSGSVTHTYTNAGRYVVKGHLHFLGDFNNNTKSCLTIVAAVPKGQPSNLGSTSFMVTSSFGGCNNLVSVNVSGLINKRHTGELGIQMFNGCSSLTQITGLETWDVSNLTELAWTFYNIPNIKSITGLKNWDTSKLNKLYFTFNGCGQLRQLDIESWNTSNLKILQSAFLNCSNLDLSILKDWDVSNIESLTGAFQGNLGIDFSWLENWNISSKLNNMSNLINGALNLESLDLSRWNCPNIKNMGSAFYNCKKLKTLNISGIGNIGMIEEPDDTYGTLSSFFGYCTVLEDMILGDNFIISSDKQLNGRYLFSSATALTTETLVSILNHLADRTGKTTNTLYFPPQYIRKLSAEQILIATEKNWTIVQV